MPSSGLRGRERGQQVFFPLFVSSGFIEEQLAHVGIYRCRNLARLHLAWVGGIRLHPPHPPTKSCMYVRLLAYVVARCFV
jgi:hypothetical protein